MNDSRRALLKSLPFFAAGNVPFKADGAEHQAAATAAEVNNRVVFAFRLTRPAPRECIATLNSNIRAILDNHGFSDALFVVLPEYLGLDIYTIEGAKRCSESAPSK